MMTWKTLPFTHTAIHTRPGSAHPPGPAQPLSRLCRQGACLLNQSNADADHLLGLLLSPPD